MTAPFVNTDIADADLGVALSQSVARGLRRMSEEDRAAGLDVQIRGPDGVSAPLDSGDARLLGQENGAQVLVYGTVVQRHGTLSVRPRLFLDPRWLVGAEEFGGVYALDQVEAGSVGTHNSAAVQALLRDVVASNLAGLSQLAVGLSWFDANRMRRALVWLRRAAVRTKGRFETVVDLFQGNALGRLGRFNQAAAAYRIASRRAPNFARARLGSIEVRFHLSAHRCDNSSDGVALRGISISFSRVALAVKGDDLASQALRLRARLGQARADYCLSQAGLADRWRLAEAGFRTVLRLGHGRLDRFRTEIAEAHGWLGFTLLPEGPGAADATDKYLRARRQFIAARALSDDSERRREFASMIGFVNGRLELSG